MPFYEYECKSCGHQTEAMQKISDAPLKKCPDCGKSQLVRLMSAPVFRLKGGGWYETDFKGDQDHKKNLADRPDGEGGKDDKKSATDAKAADGAADSTKPAGDKSADKSDEKSADKPADNSSAKPSDKPADKTAPSAAERKPSSSGISKRGVTVAAKPVARADGGANANANANAKASKSSRPVAARPIAGRSSSSKSSSSKSTSKTKAKGRR